MTALSLSSRPTCTVWSAFCSRFLLHTLLSPWIEFCCVCTPILLRLLHPVRGNLGAPHSCGWLLLISLLLSCAFGPSLRPPVVWSCPDPACSQSLGMDVTDTRVGLGCVHFWGSWRRKLTQEHGVVRLSYICKASALLTNGHLCCLQSTGDFWGPSCSVRALINNKCLSPPAWTNCTSVCASTFQHHPAPVEARNNTFLRPGCPPLGIFPWLECCTLILSRPLIFQGESCNELWELRRRVVEQNKCARGGFWCFFQVNAITKDKTSPAER